MCEWQPAVAGTHEAYIMPVAQQLTAEQQKNARDVNRRYIPGEDEIPPVRVIRDTYPTYSALAVDFNSNEVFLQDENLFGIKVFDRMTNTPANAAFSEPKRMIDGPETKLEFNCGLYVDPKTGDIYSVANDTVDTMVVFPRNAEGNVKPMRELSTPHGTFGIAVDEEAQELFLTVQHEHAVVVYRKQAEGREKELRRIEGPKTQLEDPHGIALDTKNGVIYVSSHGNYNERQKPGTGRFDKPSITAYPLKGSGDIAPLRIIEGPKTRMNWPAAMAFDPVTGDLFVANDVDDSILVFGPDDEGDVAPKRMIRGPRTGIKNPTGVYLDEKNREVWVASMGNHSATVYPINASGNQSPLRTIRSAPRDKLALAIGNPGAVAYDSKRKEILVPN
jgi:DNA-binding beta-propeller fold protein YncE